MTDRAADLMDKILALTPAERLRLAADLLEHGRADVAELLIERVRDELALFAVPTKAQA